MSVAPVTNDDSPHDRNAGYLARDGAGSRLGCVPVDVDERYRGAFLREELTCGQSDAPPPPPVTSATRFARRPTTPDPQTSVRLWPGRTTSRDFVPSTQLSPGASNADADRTVVVAGSRPGGTVPQ